MLDDYLTTELKPVVDREIARLKNTASGTLAAGMGTLVDKLATKLPSLAPPAGNTPLPPNHPLFTMEELKKLADLSTDEMVERLKRSEMGEKLLTELGDKAQAVFDELGKRYEAVGVKFTKSFREHSRVWATIVALIVAFALNVDTIFIADTYMKNEGIRQAVIAQKDSLEQGYKAVQKQFEDDANKKEVSKEEFEQAFSDAKGQLDIFTSAGFPVGYSYYPYACAKHPDNLDCKERSLPTVILGGKISISGTLIWFVGCILTGLLAGLGGPFWYDVVGRISRTVQNVRDPKKSE
jgi:hypothetical protein